MNRFITHGWARSWNAFQKDLMRCSFSFSSSPCPTGHNAQKYSLCSLGREHRFLSALARTSMMGYPDRRLFFSLLKRLGTHLLWVYLVAFATANFGWSQANHLERALHFLSQGKLDSASHEARLALADPATQPQAWGILGTILLRQGKGGEAVKDLEQAIALNPRLVGARINLGEAFLSLGQTASAEQAFKSALRLAPDNFNARLDLAELQTSLHHYRQSLELRSLSCHNFGRLMRDWFYLRRIIWRFNKMKK